MRKITDAGREARKAWRDHKAQCNCDNKHGRCQMFTEIIKDAIQEAEKRGLKRGLEQSGYIDGEQDGLLRAADILELAEFEMEVRILGIKVSPMFISGNCETVGKRLAEALRKELRDE